MRDGEDPVQDQDVEGREAPKVSKHDLTPKLDVKYPAGVYKVTVTDPNTGEVVGEANMMDFGIFGIDIEATGKKSDKGKDKFRASLFSLISPRIKLDSFNRAFGSFQNKLPDMLAKSIVPDEKKSRIVLPTQAEINKLS